MANMVDHILRLAQTISGEVPAEIPEVKSLRWLANMWTQVEKPTDDADRMSNAIHLYCTAAADRMEAMSEAVDYARTINAENVRLKAELEALKIDKLNLTSMVEELEKVRAERDSIVAYIKKGGCACNLCKHCACDTDDEPCASCFTGQNYPKWEWEGE